MTESRWDEGTQISYTTYEEAKRSFLEIVSLFLVLKKLRSLEAPLTLVEENSIAFFVCYFVCVNYTDKVYPKQTVLWNGVDVPLNLPSPC
mmetsp:Transcript_40421/g.41067  ORF Transcript_40421/g.41067 Transcript_40421/m.41067 type:complete len:90 (+) Transcript_40421:1-270(+)